MQFIVSILPWIQIGLSVILVVLILFQRSEAALGAAFGGSSENIQHTKRGLEKGLFISTIAIAILFTLASLSALFLK